MSEQEFNALFSRRLKYFLDMNDMTQTDLAKKLGVSAQSVTNWVRGVKTPRMDKIDAMCEIFHCDRSDLMSEKSDPEDHYYFDPETAQLAQELHDNEDQRLLLKASRKLKPEALKALRQFVEQQISSEDDYGV